VHWLSFRFWVIYKYSSLLTSNYQFRQICFVLSALHKVRTDFLSKFLILLIAFL
jgi:hypothetical protein